MALEYETDININDVESLRKEAEEIWPVFRVNVENEKMVNAIIKASKPKKKTGLINNIIPIPLMTQSQKKHTKGFEYNMRSDS